MIEQEGVLRVRLWLGRTAMFNFRSLLQKAATQCICLNFIFISGATRAKKVSMKLGLVTIALFTGSALCMDIEMVPFNMAESMPAAITTASPCFMEIFDVNLVVPSDNLIF